MLPADTFIVVMRGLMGNQLASVRRKAMELLNNKLQHRAQWDEQQVAFLHMTHQNLRPRPVQNNTFLSWSVSQVAALLQLSADLLNIVGKAHGKVAEEEAEQAINRQTALYSLKLLCRCFGSTHQEAFVPALLQAVQIVTAEDEEKNVTGSALLCIAEVVGALKALAIPQLPRSGPALTRPSSW